MLNSLQELNRFPKSESEDWFLKPMRLFTGRDGYSSGERSKTNNVKEKDKEFTKTSRDRRFLYLHEEFMN